MGFNPNECPIEQRTPTCRGNNNLVIDMAQHFLPQHHQVSICNRYSCPHSHLSTLDESINTPSKWFDSNQQEYQMKLQHTQHRNPTTVACSKPSEKQCLWSRRRKETRIYSNRIMTITRKAVSALVLKLLGTVSMMMHYHPSIINTMQSI